MCERAALLGIHIVTIGCGQARAVDPDFSRTRAYDQIGFFLREAATICQEYCIQAVIEPLNKEETNILNSVAETTKLIEDIHRPEIQLLADYYHIMKEGLLLKNELERGKSFLQHVHTADRDRRYPGYSPGYQLAFLGALRSIGYNGRISVECHFVNFQEELRQALTYMRHCISTTDILYS